MPQLAVNLSPIGILRQAYERTEPDPVAAAVMAETAGADAIATHLREDRATVTDRDVRLLRQIVKTRLFLRGAPSAQMIGMALDIKPERLTLVAENRQSQAPGEGLDLLLNRDAVHEVVQTLDGSGIEICLSVTPDPEQIKIAHRLDVRGIEIFIGDAPAIAGRALERVLDAVRLAAKLKLEIHVGSGLDYALAGQLSEVKDIDWLVAGHCVVSRALLTGLDRAVRDMRDRIRVNQM